MDHALIERLARQADTTRTSGPDWLPAFAALIAEECAKEAEHWQRIGRPDHKCGEYIAGAIRQLFKA